MEATDAVADTIPSPCTVLVGEENNDLEAQSTACRVQINTVDDRATDTVADNDPQCAAVDNTAAAPERLCTIRANGVDILAERIDEDTEQ